MQIKPFYILIIVLFLGKFCFSQTDSLTPVNYKARKTTLLLSSSLLTASSLIYLNQAWYKQYNTGKFHFFNDNAEWLQMDKAGHFYTNYQLSRLMMGAFEWAGFKKKQAVFIGGTIGLAYMTAVECMDGFSNGWGFSYGDQLANVLGTSLAIGQKLAWNQQRVQIKFSYATSGIAKYNPALLGDNFKTQLLKDYNGQTFWISINPVSFFYGTTKFPKWLNLAVGYSAYGMLGARQNTFVVQDDNGNVLKFDRQRRVYASIDLDLTQIQTKSKVLKKMFSIISVLKFPAPTIQFSKNNAKFYYLYY